MFVDHRLKIVVHQQDLRNRRRLLILKICLMLHLFTVHLGGVVCQTFKPIQDILFSFKGIDFWDHHHDKNGFLILHSGTSTSFVMYLKSSTGGFRIDRPTVHCHTCISQLLL